MPLSAMAISRPCSTYCAIADDIGALCYCLVNITRRGKLAGIAGGTTADLHAVFGGYGKREEG